MNQTRFDALIVGSGAAGLYTALRITELAPNWRIGLATKDNLSTSASDWAQGGIAAVIDKNDAPQFHGKDTLQAGVGLCEAEAVDILVNAAPRQIQQLIALGVDFDRAEDGSLALTLEAAHSMRRVLHSADTTGRALVSKLAAAVLQNPQIQVLSQTLVLDLHMDKGRCGGVFYLDRDQEIGCLVSPIVVLAAGGGAQVFSQNTNPPSSTGDGVAIAWRAGAVIRDMEFVQFHPTALALPDAPRFLISEAVRGEGAHLIDRQGDRFAFNYHPKGELAPRDVVSRAIFSHLQQTKEATVFLDLQPIPKHTISHRFPNIIKICQQWQIDIFSTPIPVTPAAHYCMGGIVVDSDGATSIEGLYAVGEAASTGVHGANRLASNSLLECFVFGERLAERVCAQPTQIFVLPKAIAPQLADRGNSATIQNIKWVIQTLSWQAAGICRVQAELETALTQIIRWQDELINLAEPSRLWIETRNLADYAYLLMRSALFRTESRGAHYRDDFPDTDPSWRSHTLITGQDISRSSIL
ncbi:MULTISPECIES: L-aspartate oxidase [Pseudanabaena]|uniref:L-aspartate oxidase n=2 Tax=Pseudanabaena TaxID=1152 RepID=L8N0A0_9CYAN|nr:MULTISPECIES: L-aspartate oxidase [Pseudanabaena]ELS32469.1 L-aspartate oxidase [Pseudanabaena biceps PCC 7429]MDG3495291.1 L-aspartate oxidase [Pseudanabaena catenata USMAC16]